MKSFNKLYQNIYCFNNIHVAYLKARKNKRYRDEVLEFESRLEENLLTIHNELVTGTYSPSRYNQFYVRYPKERLILALPFKDRVIHQAVCAVIEPLFDRTFIFDSYACRKNKGVVAGVKRLGYFLNKCTSSHKEVYCLKMDIRKYFYSIDHNVLKSFLRKKIRCSKTLNLLNLIIDSTDNPGIPVGNLTSQLFANIYLSRLDHFIKEELGSKHYIRYMDDMVILHPDKKYLWTIYQEVKNFTETVLHLNFNSKTSVFNIKRGIDFLGYRTFPHRRILRKSVLIRTIKKFKKFIRTNAGRDNIKKSLASLSGLCAHCSGENILYKVKVLTGEKQWMCLN